MIFSKKLMTVAVLMAASSIATAATDTAEIEINVTKDAYVNFIGDLAGNASKDLSVTEVNGTVTTLGNLGTESNTTGGCAINISSKNDFRLQHNVDSSLYLHQTNHYSINYSGESFTSGSAPTLNLASCNNAASPMQIATPGFASSQVQAGTYSDILTVTVTTE
ncbi:hypothetical protein GCM10009133_21130 [Cocleimonas flava]|uniref:Spore coat protein U-like protein n=1 Tax=Cocleimonas flava TaxID=634765 RepID=A0A4R1EU71_9GAMM|nr:MULTISPECIES: hypothetical protein [Cocleimonas]MEB8433181.1 hypothetical protein [Cocleimonas sp. KMM 6892]MEC4715838.1 hypothetical protein [Cocleimonas sp. KMM 6895]MEC4745299.1 hypothetical protein [Cocleimonas sp. KMM 6896]TCJ82648.1 hypothetical protein EV695_3379 [Cocleimonas flava]